MMVRNRSVYSPMVIIGLNCALQPIRKSSAAGIDHLVAEESAGKKQADRAEHEGQHVAALVAVKSRRDEDPNLVQHERRRHEDPRHERDLQVHIEGIGGIQVDELLLQSGGPRGPA